jgi:dienelactone hydrolase
MTGPSRAALRLIRPFRTLYSTTMKTFLPVLGLLVLSLLSPASALPALSDTVRIAEWLVCGPFPVGTREGLTGVVEDPLIFQPGEGDTFRSAMVQGGVTKCRRVKLDSLGFLNTDYQGVRWDTLQDYYGNIGVSCAGFAYAEFESPRACRALALSPKLGGFVLNGRSYIGDVYGSGWFRVPVQLDSGANRVLLRLSGYGDQQVKFILVPPGPDLLVVAKDVTAPDLVADSGLRSWLGVPLVNSTTERRDTAWLSLKTLAGEEVGDTFVTNLPGFGARKAAVRIAIPAQKFDSAGFRLVITAAVRGNDSIEKAPPETVALRIRRPEQARKQTFIAEVDRSVQYYAVVYPGNYDPQKRYALILSLHGAGVEASGQADSYRPKDWAFVVAATNRRPFGFDWQDWGRLDAIEVLDNVLSSQPVDRDRVLLTGHSMGGHGVWHVGLAHSDLFAAAAPEAGWPSIQLYVPWTLQRSNIFAEPPQVGIRDMALRPDNAPAMLVNALNLPLFLLHGGDDDNVPTFHGRNFAEWLDELGYRYTYKEVEGKPHWWSYDDGTSCLDDTSLMSFLKDQRREPGPRHILLRTADLGQSNRSFWASIDRVRVVGRDAEIEAWALDSLIRVKTRNIGQFSLDLDGRLFFPSTVGVEIDGQRIPGRSILPARLVFSKGARGWQRGAARAGGLAKTPGQYGPAKQAMMGPFLLVYGTAAKDLADVLRHSATQEAVRWWLIGNGDAQVLPDTEVTKKMIEQFNLVLFGSQAENEVTRRLAGHLPVQVKAGRMLVNGKDLGDSLAGTVVYPSPLNPKRLVLVRMGTDAVNTRLALSWGSVFSSAGTPDFLVFDRSVRRNGWAGVRAAGFFNADWAFDPASSYVRE